MKHSPSIAKRLLAAFWLAAFVNVYVVQSLCSLNLGSFDATSVIGKKTATDTQPHDHASHSHGSDHAHAVPKTEAKDHSQQSAHHDKESDESCCKDQTTSFFASLTKPGVLKFDFSFKSVTSYPAGFHFQPSVYTSWDWKAPVKLVPPEHLKPKIPDIRIFTGSLLI